jgi:hypothetical protein
VLYFNGKDDHYALIAMTESKLSLEMIKWNADEYTWVQSSTGDNRKVSYTLRVFKPSSIYSIYDGIKSIQVKSDKDGILKFDVKSNKNEVHLKIIPAI